MRVALVRRLGFEPPLDADGEAALIGAAKLLEEQGAIVEEADPGLPDTRAIFGRVWGVALARLVATTPAEKRPLLDAGLAEVAEREGAMLATDFLGAEALRNCRWQIRPEAAFHRDDTGRLRPMRLVTFKKPQRLGTHIGALREDGAVLDLAAADPALAGGHLPSLIAGGAAALQHARDAAAEAWG